MLVDENRYSHVGVCNFCCWGRKNLNFPSVNKWWPVCWATRIFCTKKIPKKTLGYLGAALCLCECGYFNMYAYAYILALLCVCVFYTGGSCHTYFTRRCIWPLMALMLVVAFIFWSVGMNSCLFSNALIAAYNRQGQYVWVRYAKCRFNIAETTNWWYESRWGEAEADTRIFYLAIFRE